MASTCEPFTKNFSFDFQRTFSGNIDKEKKSAQVCRKHRQPHAAFMVTSFIVLNRIFNTVNSCILNVIKNTYEYLYLERAEQNYVRKKLY